jgi:alpha-galactosidase
MNWLSLSARLLVLGAIATFSNQLALSQVIDSESLALASAARITIPVTDSAPAIHGAKLVGATLGREFLFLIPATGLAPLHYSAIGLPKGLSVNSNTGVISGIVIEPGLWKVDLQVSNQVGSTHRIVTLIGNSNAQALTPPMGWDSLNLWGANINEDKVHSAADAMVSSGLAAHGYQYVNIDDAWEGARNRDGKIEPNNKFSNIGKLVRSIHNKGLKVGIYSSPGTKTCAGYTGSYLYEKQDAEQYAKWGIDYLKYDWCSYGSIAGINPSLDALKKPYQVMKAALDASGRDILFSLCQYGMGSVWQWGASVGGNSWRVAGDVNDSWASVSSIFEKLNDTASYAGSGHWNDPDILVVGDVGWGRAHSNGLTPAEQTTQVSLWCMCSAPLIVGCDLSKLDNFTTALLTNDEVIDIDQDPLGKAASKIPLDPDTSDGHEIWERPLADGSIAVAMVNTTTAPLNISLKWADLGLPSSDQPVRDLWLHLDLGNIEVGYTASVPAHGTVLLKIGKSVE